MFDIVSKTTPPKTDKPRMGRPSLFTKNIRKTGRATYSVSREARAIITKASKRTSVSRSDIIDALIRTHGPTFDPAPFRQSEGEKGS